jgi:hypothetical protein
MMKPAFADCWTVGSKDSLKIIESYSMPGGDVVIGIADDGEIEYNLKPKDYSYSRELSEILGKTIDGIRDEYRKKGGNLDRQSVMMSAKDRICKSWEDSMDVDWSMNGLCEATYRYVLGLGIFKILMSDERIEDIYVDAPCDKSRLHITMNRVEGFNNHPPISIYPIIAISESHGNGGKMGRVSYELSEDNRRRLELLTAFSILNGHYPSETKS